MPSTRNLSPISAISPVRITAFQRRIFRFYAKHGRRLSFRETTDSYKIAVAEIMLQQTQVDRVIPKWESWVRRWPSWKSLANATNRQLLAEWQGLGYNRRALFLGKAAQVIVDGFGGTTPRDPALLQTLPGIGPYTANAILIFAFNAPLVTIDTNIRRVLLHEFGLPATLSKPELEQLAWRVLPKRRSRDWHNALMDYSVLALPKSIAAIPPLTKQSPFEGSIRQIRGEIVRRLARQKSVTYQSVATAMNRSHDDVLRAATSLEKDGVVKCRVESVRLK
ncbi:MAG: Fe-S cluster assembly protein HesB [Candidatus Zixiibacteriota bacterium]